MVFSSLAFSQGLKDPSDRIVIAGYVHDDCPIPLDGTVSLIVPGSGEVVGVTRPGVIDGKVTFENVPRRAYQLRINVRFFAETTRAIAPGQGKTLDFGTIDIRRNMSCDIETVTSHASALLKPAAPAQMDLVDTTVCEIVKDPLQFHRKLVRVRATASGPGIDTGDRLWGEGCGDGIELEMPQRSQDHNIRQLDEAIHPRPPKHTIILGAFTEGVFVGKVSYILNAAWARENYIFFELEQVEELSPHRWPTPKKK